MGTFGVGIKVEIKTIQYVRIRYITHTFPNATAQYELNTSQSH